MIKKNKIFARSCVACMRIPHGEEQAIYLFPYQRGKNHQQANPHTGASTRAASSGRAELVPEQVAAAGAELVISWQWQPPFRLQGADFAFPSPV